MPRLPEDPSGAKETLCIALSPRHHQRLNLAAETRQQSRSQVISWLLDRLKLPGDPPKDTP